jgi:hypothetical protein
MESSSEPRDVVIRSASYHWISASIQPTARALIFMRRGAGRQPLRMSGFRSLWDKFSLTGSLNMELRRSLDAFFRQNAAILLPDLATQI